MDSTKEELKMSDVNLIRGKELSDQIEDEYLKETWDMYLKSEDWDVMSHE